MSSTGTQAQPKLTSESEVSPQFTDWQRWGELGLVLLVAVVPYIFTATFAFFHPIAGIQNLTNLGFTRGLLHQVTCILLVIYVLNRRRLSLKSLGLDFSRLRDLFVAIGLAVAALAFTTIISLVIRHYGTGRLLEMRDPRVIFAGGSPVLLLIYSAGASVFEETIVRGYVTTELAGLACPIWMASAISVLLQTSYHVYYGFGG